MNIQIVSFHCILKNKLGRVISSTFNHEVLTWDESQQNMLAGLARGLQNLKKGEKRRIALSAEQAYGFYDPQKVLHFHRNELPSGRPIHLGQTYLMRTREGKHENFRIAQINGDQVTLDGNHPLAGQDLVFEIEATAVRNATPEEISDSASTDPSSTKYLH